MIEFKDTPRLIRSLLVFNSWIIYTIKTKDKFNHYDSYKEFRYWIINVAIECEIDLSSVPKVNKKNSKNILADCKNVIDIRSLKKMSSTNSKILLINNKLTAI